MTTYYIDPALGSDSNAGTSAGAGNAWQTAAAAISLPVAAGDLINWKASATTTLTTTQSFTVAGTKGAPITWRGYTTTPGDGGRAAVTSATTTVNLFSVAADFQIFDSFAFSHTGATRGAGLIAAVANRNGISLLNSTINGCRNGVDGSNLVLFFFADLTVSNCEIKSCTVNGIANGGHTFLSGNFIHDNTGDGFNANNAAVANSGSIFALDRNVIYHNANNIKDTLTSGKRFYLLRNNTIHSATTDGVNIAVTSAQGLLLDLENNIIYGNTGNGVATAVAPFALVNRNNAYGANGTDRVTIGAGSGDVTLSGDPCTSAGASGNFALTTTAGGGGACRAAGFPGALIVGGTGFLDIGALQRADPVATGTIWMEG